MTNHVKLAVAVMACLLLAGCRAQGEVGTHPVSAPTSQLADPENPLSADVPVAAPDFSRRVDDAWKRFGNPQDPKSLRTEWVGLDDSDQLVVGGRTLLDVPAWMDHPDVSQVIVRQETMRSEPGSSVALGIVTRSKYQVWPQVKGEALPFSASDATKYVDLWAEGTVSPRRVGDDRVKSWLAGRLGNRLIDVRITRDGHILATAIVSAGTLSAEERILEAATLQAGLDTVTEVQTLVVEYQGATEAKRVQVPTLSEWAKQGANTALLRNCVEVDGVREKGCPMGGTKDSDGFANLLADKAKIQAFFPKGAHVTIADAGYTRVVVEGDATGDATRDQVLSMYGDAVEKVFSGFSGVFEVELLLKRGKDVEYFLFDENRWSVRHFLVQQMGVSVPPEALVMTANDYQLYRLVTP